MRVRKLALPFLLFVAFVPPVLHAQVVVRTWVATTGTDNPSCARSAPCRTFGAAVAAVDPGGEVVVLDSGGYGAFVITKAVTVVAPAGIHAAIAPTSGVAIDVAAGASDVVRLVNLHLTGKGADFGIYSSGSELTIEDSSIFGFTNSNVAIVGGGRVTLARTTSSGASGSALHAEGGTAPAILTVDDSRFQGSNNGIRINSHTLALIRDSIVSGNHYGIAMWGSTAFPVHATIENSALWSNAFGLAVGGQAAPTGTARLSGSTVVDNTTGVWMYSGGIVYSRGNNTIHGNATTFSGGSLTALAGQ